MAANITERDDGNIRARMRLAVTVFGIVGAVVTFLSAVSSSILSLVTRTELSTVSSSPRKRADEQPLRTVNMPNNVSQASAGRADFNDGKYI